MKGRKRWKFHSKAMRGKWKTTQYAKNDLKIQKLQIILQSYEYEGLNSYDSGDANEFHQMSNALNNLLSSICIYRTSGKL